MQHWTVQEDLERRQAYYCLSFLYGFKRFENGLIYRFNTFCYKQTCLVLKTFLARFKEVQSVSNVFCEIVKVVLDMMNLQIGRRNHCDCK